MGSATRIRRAQAGRQTRALLAPLATASPATIYTHAALALGLARRGSSPRRL